MYLWGLCPYSHSLFSVLNTALSTIYRFVARRSTCYSKLWDPTPYPAFSSIFAQALRIPGSLPQPKHSGFLLSSKPLSLLLVSAVPFPCVYTLRPNSDVISSRIYPHENFSCTSPTKHVFCSLPHSVEDSVFSFRMWAPGTDSCLCFPISSRGAKNKIGG